MATFIAQNVSIDPRAEIGDEVHIGPFCVIGPDVKIGHGTRLENNVTLMGHVTLGEHNHLFPGVVIGASRKTSAIVAATRGWSSAIAISFAKASRSIAPAKKKTASRNIGNSNFLMACCHVAHDCKLGDHIIMANATLLGGHVHIYDHATLSGGIGVHHFTTIGRYSFVAGLARVIHDVPPFMLCEGHPARPRCINVVALKRNNFTTETIHCLSETHRLLYRAKVGLDHAREILRTNEKLVPAVNELLSFIQTQQEGKHGRSRERRRAA